MPTHASSAVDKSNRPGYTYLTLHQYLGSHLVFAIHNPLQERNNQVVVDLLHVHDGHSFNGGLVII